MATSATEDEEGHINENEAPSFYRLNSNLSRTSIFENVEMAQDELFSGPIAESLPTSTSAFAHHRRRADSIASFSYYNEEDDNSGLLDLDDERRSSIDPGDFPVFDGASDDDEDMDALEEGHLRDDYALHRRQSGVSITSASARLLRSDSMATATSGRLSGGRTSQKIYLPNEDMTIVVAGFSDSAPALWAYHFLCVLTFGLFYLVLRWLPRWYIRFVGKPCALGECEWVVVEVGRDGPLLTECLVASHHGGYLGN
jgi:cation-transporting ATPase 13A2